MMFAKKKSAPTIDSLIGAGASVDGNLRFRGGLRIDGHVAGSVVAEDDPSAMLVLSESARIEGPVRAAHLVVSGTIEGPVQADDMLELLPGARITGEVRYRSMEIHPGAVVEGALVHLEGDRPALSLAVSQG